MLVVVLVVLVALTAAGGVSAYTFLTRDKPVVYSNIVEQYKYGSIGTEELQGIPYELWVVLPEVFVKALNLARNLGRPVRRITTIDMDFTRHYRPAVNVLARPTATGGRGIALTGHHEIMFPLLWAAVEETLR